MSRSPASAWYSPRTTTSALVTTSRREPAVAVWGEGGVWRGRGGEAHVRGLGPRRRRQEGEIPRKASARTAGARLTSPGLGKADQRVCCRMRGVAFDGGVSEELQGVRAAVLEMVDLVTGLDDVGERQGPVVVGVAVGRRKGRDTGSKRCFGCVYQ